MNANTLRQFVGLSRAPIVGLLLWGSIPALAQQPTPAPSKEMRENMASMHEKMAACLRSDKEFNECRREMYQRCATMGEQACPMMRMGKQGQMTKPPQQQ